MRITNSEAEHQQNKQMNEVLFDLQNPLFNIIYNHYKKEVKAIPVTGQGGP
jgi:hypothetical protein